MGTCTATGFVHLPELVTLDAKPRRPKTLSSIESYSSSDSVGSFLS
jgi:hypothetical protein